MSGSQTARRRQSLVEYLKQANGPVTLHSVRRDAGWHKTYREAKAALRFLAASGKGQWEFVNVPGIARPLRAFRLLADRNRT